MEYYRNIVLFTVPNYPLALSSAKSVFFVPINTIMFLARLLEYYRLFEI